jgi:hypothetical protein
MTLANELRSSGLGLEGAEKKSWVCRPVSCRGVQAHGVGEKRECFFNER